MKGAIFMEEATKVPPVEVFTTDPFSSEFVAKKQAEYKEKIMPSAQQIVATPFYNHIAKFLGIDTTREWNKYYDKVFMISEWARERSSFDDEEKVVAWISEVLGNTPSIGATKLDDLYIRLTMEDKKDE